MAENGNGILPAGADPLKSVSSTLDAINLTLFQGVSRDPLVGPLAKTIPPPPKISGVFTGQTGLPSLPGLPSIQGFPKLPPLPNLSKLSVKQAQFNGTGASKGTLLEPNVFS